MIQVANRRSSMQLDIAISPPIFEWRDVPSLYFSMIHTALSNDIAVSPGDFSGTSANNLGELTARYNVFGGSNNISLHPDRLSMEFPALVPGDDGLVLKIMELVFEAFRHAFPDHLYSTIHARHSSHVEILAGGTVSEYLARYAVPSLDDAFGRGDIVLSPGVLFDVNDAAAALKARCMVERSEFLANGLFTNLYLTFWRIDDSDAGFRHFYGLYSNIVDRCSTALELDWTNEP